MAFYEVAVGTDRRFPKSRDNIVPFTNIGQNKTVTFYNLDLVPGTGLYYFTVRAYSASYSVALVTSNGFHVGFDGGVTRKYFTYKSVFRDDPSPKCNVIFQYLMIS